MSYRDLERRMRLLRAVQREVSPDPAWVTRTRLQLLQQVSASLAPQPLPLLARLREMYRRIRPNGLGDFVRGPLFAALSLLTIVAGGSVASVSAAERSLPGDWLFSVKLASEQTKLLFAKGKTEKLRLKASFVERRAQEIKTIATTNVSEKPTRIREATDILRRDLDSVKKQLTEVAEENNDAPVQQVVEAAKLIDQKSGELVITLKEVKKQLSEESKENIAAAETAAVVTGVKALQVLIDSHQDPDAQEFLSKEELTKSIQDKVSGIEDKIVSTAQQIVMEPATSGTQMTVSSTLQLVDTGHATSAVPLISIKSAQQSLDQAKQSFQDDNLTAVREQLGAAAKAVTVAETEVEVRRQQERERISDVITGHVNITSTVPTVAVNVASTTTASNAVTSSTAGP